MQFPCPACAAPITVNPPKPGRYNPKCPKCGVPFVLAIQVNPPASGAVRPPAPRRPAVVDAESTLPTAPELPPPADEGTFVSQPTAPEAEFDPDSTAATRLAPGGDGAEATADFDTAARARGKSNTAPAEDDDGDHAALGGYEVLKRIGKGGMGAVYLAR